MLAARGRFGARIARTFRVRLGFGLAWRAVRCGARGAQRLWCAEGMEGAHGCERRVRHKCVPAKGFVMRDGINRLVPIRIYLSLDRACGFSVTVGARGGARDKTR